MFSWCSAIITIDLSIYYSRPRTCLLPPVDSGQFPRIPSDAPPCGTLGAVGGEPTLAGSAGGEMGSSCANAPTVCLRTVELAGGKKPSFQKQNVSRHGKVSDGTGVSFRDGPESSGDVPDRTTTCHNHTAMGSSRVTIDPNHPTTGPNRLAIGANHHTPSPNRRAIEANHAAINPRQRAILPCCGAIRACRPDNLSFPTRITAQARFSRMPRAPSRPDAPAVLLRAAFPCPPPGSTCHWPNRQPARREYSPSLREMYWPTPPREYRR